MRRGQAGEKGNWELSVSVKVQLCLEKYLPDELGCWGRKSLGPGNEGMGDGYPDKEKIQGPGRTFTDEKMGGKREVEVGG